MLRQFVRISLVASALSLTVACSKGGGNNDNGGAVAPNLKGGQVSNMALEANAWCNNFSDQGTNYQDHYLFKDGGALESTRFEIVNGQRANPQTTNTNWSTLDTQLAIGPADKAIVGTYRIDPQDAITQAKKLHFLLTGKDGNQTDFALDPCQ